MTVYNRERYLAAAIESVLAQTSKDFELLVWDDGSGDRSLEIAQNYAHQDPRVKVVAAAHQGYVRSLADAHSFISGEYVGWIDSDDKLRQGALEATAAILDASPDVGMVYTDHMIIDERDHLKGVGRRCYIPYSKERLMIDFVTFHFRLFRRNIYDAVGGIYRSLQCAPDYDLCLRFSEVTQIYHLKQPLYYYRVHGDSISRQNRKNQILASKLAVERALHRRGLSERFQLIVDIEASIFRLIPTGRL